MSDLKELKVFDTNFQDWEIEKVNELPENLQKLTISCRLELLENTPESLKHLKIIGNELKELKHLPTNLEILNLLCTNSIKVLSDLPINLQELIFCNTKITSFTIPSRLTKLHCINSNLEILPELPETLRELDCSHNKLISLPKIPENLEFLICFENNIKILSNLPKNTKLNCDKFVEIL